jgi:hypothetical protein
MPWLQEKRETMQILILCYSTGKAVAFTKKRRAKRKESAERLSH